MFKEARLKLTGWYLLIIAVILFIFSSALYLGIMNLTQRALEIQSTRLERRMMETRRAVLPVAIQQSLLEETQKDILERTLTVLASVNLLILIVSGFLSYWLAGKTLDPIQNMVEKQKKFVADASHELKTPLTGMKTDLEVTLRDKNLDINSARETLTRTISEIDSMTELTNILLKESQYQNQSSQNGFEKIDLLDISKIIANKISLRFNEKNIKLNVEGASCLVWGNKTALEELLKILLDNALKFTESGSVTVTVYSNGCLEVSDTGIGISKEELHKVFDRFYRGETSRNKNTSAGFGLGLSIAQEIVNWHKGSLSVESELSKGTTFKIKLPLSKI